MAKIVRQTFIYIHVCVDFDSMNANYINDFKIFQVKCNKCDMPEQILTAMMLPEFDQYTHIIE